MHSFFVGEKGCDELDDPLLQISLFRFGGWYATRPLLKVFLVKCFIKCFWVAIQKPRKLQHKSKLTVLPVAVIKLLY